MGLPFTYNIRNLKRRKMRTALTIAGTTLVVLVSIVMLSFSRGMFLTMKSTGSPDNVLIMSRKGQSLMNSSLTAEDYNHLRNIPEIKKDESGEPLVSPEIFYACNLDAGGGRYQGKPGVVHGVEPIAYKVNDKIKITEGNIPEKGFQVIAGKLTYTKLGVPEEAVAVGEKIYFEGKEWTIVGKFSAGGTALESEFWTDAGDLMTVLNRQTYTSAIIKLNNIVDMERLIADLNSRIDIVVKAMPEQAYYLEFAAGFERIVYLAIIISIIALIGGLMNGMNTMYTTILSRIREIATLKILGFSKTSIILSFIMESLIITGIGAIIGALLGFSLNGIPAKIGRVAFTFRVDLIVIMYGLAMGFFIGIFGALLPSLKATRISIPSALRYE